MKTVTVGIFVDSDTDRLRQTLVSLQQHPGPKHQLVALLDGIQPVPSWPASSLEGVLQSGTPEVRGAAACFNRLISSGTSDVIVFLESGVTADAGWLDRLLAGLAADPANGLAGPSTNRCWNAQGIFPKAGCSMADVKRCSAEASRRFGNETRTLEPLYSLAEFTYAVRREVVDAIGLADESYGLGPCWEMDYNIRAARAGWRGVWVPGAYVHRAPMTERRRQDEDRWFEASKRRYQDKFCGARLRGEKADYRSHCRGDACPNFAPHLQKRSVSLPKATSVESARPVPSPPAIEMVQSPLVSCIMPTCDRLPFVQQAIDCFLKQDYTHSELIVIDDGRQPVEPLLPKNPRIRLIRLPERKCVGTKRNIGATAAHGELIVHWDDDDWYPRDRVRRQAGAMDGSQSAVCGTSTLFYMEPATGRAWQYRYSGNRAWVAGNTLAYRKSWWSAHPFPDIQVGEDTRFVWNTPAGVVADLNDPSLCVAQIHDNNTSRKTTGSAFWQTHSPSDLQRLLGDDWHPFLAAGGCPSSSGKPLVSCIMPTHNRRSLLVLSLDCFQAQQYSNKELIVVDDGSDPVADAVRDLEFVRYIALPKRTTIGRKRNLACESARGSIIAHWDDDDWYAPHRLSVQVAPLLAGAAEMTGLVNSFQAELSTGNFWRPTPELHRRMFVGDVHGGTLVYWKRIFDQGARYPEVNLAEDAAFLRTAQRRGQRLLRLENSDVFVYMRHGRNAWQFQSGEFIDRAGWEMLGRPMFFPESTLQAFRDAAST